MKKLVSGALAAAMCLSLSACGGGGGGGAAADIPEVDIPAINEISLGTDYKDLTAEIKVLTNRTDVVDTVYAGYVQKFNQMYPPDHRRLGRPVLHPDRGAEVPAGRLFRAARRLRHAGRDLQFRPGQSL